MVKYKMPEDFRWELDCLMCPASISADGHDSMACMDVWLSAHLDEFGHNRFTLTIYRAETHIGERPQKGGRPETVMDRARLHELLDKFKANEITNSELGELKVYCEEKKRRAAAAGDAMGETLNMLMLLLINCRPPSRRQKKWYERLFGR